MAGDTFFQSKVTVNVFQVEIYISKQIKNHHCICFNVTRMKTLTKSNLGLGVNLLC